MNVFNEMLSIFDWGNPFTERNKVKAKKIITEFILQICFIYSIESFKSKLTNHSHIIYILIFNKFTAKQFSVFSKNFHKINTTWQIRNVNQVVFLK